MLGVASLVAVSACGVAAASESEEVVLLCVAGWSLAWLNITP